MHAAKPTRSRIRSATVPWVLALGLIGPPADARPRPPEVLGQLPAAEKDKQVSASLTLSVRDVRAATARVRELVREAGGEIESETENAAFSANVRLDPARVRGFVEEVAALGVVSSREHVVNDGRLARQQTQADRDRVRAQLERVRAEQRPGGRDLGEAADLESQLQNDELELARQADLAARASVAVVLSTAVPAAPADVHFYPGVRGSFLLDARGDRTLSLVGAGLALQLTHWLSAEAELFRGTDALQARAGADGFLLTLGVDLPSDFLGAGQRRFLNPHLGLRAGVASSYGRVDAAGGVSAGLELLRLDRMVVDAQLRVLGLAGNHLGPHLFAQPGLSICVGY